MLMKYQFLMVVFFMFDVYYLMKMGKQEK